jgi:hypothetical protein
MPRLLLCPAALCALATGCVTIYQPLSGLHRPVAIDTSYANFDDVSVTFHCVPGDVIDEGDSQTLCRSLALLFENQGALVTTRSTAGLLPEPDELTAEAEGKAPPETALNVRLESRLIHKEESRTAWPFPWPTVTTDYTFAQDISIRDETGFLLARDTLTGRFVRRFGFTSEAKKKFSADFYEQVSQLALNARMRRQVLVEAQQSARP